ncbi:MAG TPA: protein-methionine-sulfoxide reductase heme-binding subunit MsrQ [Blastocatellia bacterium]|nr:protein-methionine-sulfoxide reductase heme-binding subunit MsrQ [Blastocatellia bacterium]
MVKDIKFVKLVVFVNAAVPLVMLGWDAYHHNLGANPIEFATRTTGALTLVFLLLCLAVTPLRKSLAQPWMIKLRRMLGLYAFFYGCLHLSTYVWFDKFFDVRAIVGDTLKRPFITVGMLSFVLLTPLAVTSTNAMVKRLGGKRWNRLHKAVYVAAAGGVIHYYELVKADRREPILFGVALALLLGYRLVEKYAPNLVRRAPVRDA